MRNVIKLLKQLDYIVLAEGVEDRKTVEILRSLGCDEVQGYFYARPMVSADFAAWSRARNAATERNPCRASPFSKQMIGRIGGYARFLLTKMPHVQSR